MYFFWLRRTKNDWIFNVPIHKYLSGGFFICFAQRNSFYIEIDWRLQTEFSDILYTDAIVRGERISLWKMACTVPVFKRQTRVWSCDFIQIFQWHSKRYALKGQIMKFHLIWSRRCVKCAEMHAQSNTNFYFIWFHVLAHTKFQRD